MSSSDSELSDDEYQYQNYTVERYKSGSGPPLIAKKARIIAAVTQNDVETLRQLLDSPRWYKVRAKYGISLLRIAIFRENDEVFDFLRSLDGFQMDLEDVLLSKRYAFELSIKRAIDVNAEIDAEGNTFLHCTLRRSLIEASRSLVERGADLNAQNKYGQTPLHMCFETLVGLRDEVISMLLYYGADPSIRDRWNRTPLDVALTRECCISVEILFYFTVDEWGLYEADGWSLLNLAHRSKSVFNQVTKLISDVIYSGDTNNSSAYFKLLITVESECLRIFLEKYPCFVKEILQSCPEKSPSISTTIFHLRNAFKQFDLRNFDMLMQSSLSLDVIELISKLDSSLFIDCLQDTDKSKDEILEIIYYFLSYGMCLQEIDLQTIYKMTGFNEDFKNLLHMDVQKQPNIQIREIMPRLIYDVTLDIHKSVEDPFSCDFIDWEEILYYFHHPKIQNAYFVIKGKNDRQASQIPILKELARDTFRRYFIKIFEIRTAKQFYCLLRKLPVSSVFKKIITFETRLY